MTDLTRRASTPAVGCDGKANILLASEVFSQTVKHSATEWLQYCGGSFWPAVSVTCSFGASEGGLQEAHKGDL